MLNKVKKWMNDGTRELHTYGDTYVENVALHYIATLYVIGMLLSGVLVFITVPIWNYPYRYSYKYKYT